MKCVPGADRRSSRSTWFSQPRVGGRGWLGWASVDSKRWTGTGTRPSSCWNSARVSAMKTVSWRSSASASARPSSSFRARSAASKSLAEVDSPSVDPRRQRHRAMGEEESCNRRAIGWPIAHLRNGYAAINHAEKRHVAPSGRQHTRELGGDDTAQEPIRAATRVCCHRALGCIALPGHLLGTAVRCRQDPRPRGRDRSPASRARRPARDSPAYDRSPGVRKQSEQRQGRHQRAGLGLACVESIKALVVAWRLHTEALLGEAMMRRG